MEKNLLSQKLEKYEFIVFAVIFGSFAENKATNISDVDIGIYTNRPVTLLEIGMIVSDIEKISKTNVDLIILNDLYKKKPTLAFEIVSKGQLVFCRDKEKFIEFKKNTFIYYLDTVMLRSVIDESFKKRLRENRFGERNYVR